MRSFYSPLAISAPFLRVFKATQATQNGEKSKQGCEIRESNSGPLARRPRTNRLCHPRSLSPRLLAFAKWSFLSLLKFLLFFCLLGVLLISFFRMKQL